MKGPDKFTQLTISFRRSARIILFLTSITILFGHSVSQRMTKRVQYSPGNMAAAIDEVRNGMSQAKAARTFGVPRTTLQDKLSGRAPEAATAPGPSPVLSAAEEKVLADYSKLLCDIGYPLTKPELLFQTKRILDIDGRKTPFPNNMPGKGWYKAFRKRNGTISERTPAALGHQRAVISQDMVQGWYDGVFSYLEKEIPDHKEMLQDPRRVFNADESGFPICVRSSKVLAPVGARHVYQVTPGDKTQITVMACFNAFGGYMPPLIVYPGQRFRDTVLSGFTDAIYGHTANGWMDGDLFIAFLHHFNDYVGKEGIKLPVILFVDGHSTHISRQAAEYCAEKKIILYCLLPNATHILQAADIGLFSPMKQKWKQHVKEWQMLHLGEVFTKNHFPEVFKKTWESCTNLINSVSAFRRSGLYPFTIDGVDKSKFGPSKMNVQDSTAPIAASSNLDENEIIHVGPGGAAPVSKMNVQVSTAPIAASSNLDENEIIHVGPGGAAPVSKMNVQVSTAPIAASSNLDENAIIHVGPGCAAPVSKMNVQVSTAPIAASSNLDENEITHVGPGGAAPVSKMNVRVSTAPIAASSNLDENEIIHVGPGGAAPVSILNIQVFTAPIAASSNLDKNEITHVGPGGAAPVPILNIQVSTASIAASSNLDENAITNVGPGGAAPVSKMNDQVSTAPIAASSNLDENAITHVGPGGAAPVSKTNVHVFTAPIAASPNSDGNAITHAGPTDIPNHKPVENVPTIRADSLSADTYASTSGVVPAFQSSLSIIRDQTYVSNAFHHLRVPEPKLRKKANSLRTKLPKALSGVVALKMLREKEEKKQREEEEKKVRKIERERKKREREEEKERKRLERENAKRLRDMKKRQNKHVKKTMVDSSENESENEISYRPMDSDDDFDERAVCGVCKSSEGRPDEWVTCELCKGRLHIECTVREELYGKSAGDLKGIVFVCEACDA